MTQYQGLLASYPKIHQLGSPENDGILGELVVCQSKIDGAQFRCRFLPEENKLVFGSRRNILPDDVNTNEWIAVRAYRKAFELYPDKFIPNIVYMSESMQKHTIAYEDIPDTIGYDVFDVERDTFWNWKAAKQAFEDINIPFIHTHFEKPGRDVTVEELKALIKQSPYRKEGDEGIVLKCYTKLNPYGRPLFAKIVDDLFKEENKKVFKVQPEKVKNQENEIIERFLTDARFQKAIGYFESEGIPIEMSLIPKLYMHLGNDILSEEILTIGKEYERMNFKVFYNMIARKTALMLKTYLLERAT